MKQLLLMLVIAVIGFTGCKQDNIQHFIPGTYSRVFDQEFAKGNDTIEISRISKEGDSYRILQKATFRRILNGQLQSTTEHTQKKMTAVYDKTKKVLVVTKSGVIISFSPETNELIWGTSPYKKVQ